MTEKETYGFTPLSYELIELFRSDAPDFEAAEELLRRGADINDQGEDINDLGTEENVLSNILADYMGARRVEIEYFDEDDEDAEGCCVCDQNEERDYVDCFNCEYNMNPLPNVGEDMVKIIKFFLDHGFDVKKNNGAYGKACLSSLVFSSYDRYMVEATKRIFDAYGDDKPTFIEDVDTQLDSLDSECCYLFTCMWNTYRSNLYDTACQIYYAVEENRPYAGIQEIEAAIGKKILRVMAEKTPNQLFFTRTRENFHSDKCFWRDLYLMYEDGYIVYTPNASCWVDNFGPDQPLIDISEHFAPIVGKTITQIFFDGYSTDEWANRFEMPHRYGDAVISFKFDNNVKLHLAYKFRELKCSYFYLEKAESEE